MPLVVFLLQSSWRAVAIALATGFLSGGCSAGLIALIARTVVQDQVPSAAIAAAFVALGGVALLTAVISRILLVRFSQAAVLELQL
ncbi:MAG: ABC transporter ATP-binding protein, partial [Cyanobacteria bacterium J06635_1]